MFSSRRTASPAAASAWSSCPARYLATASFNDTRADRLSTASRFVNLRRPLVPPALKEDVAKRLERPRRGRVEVGGAAEIVGGRLELGAVLVRFTAPQVRQHRVGPEGNRAAIRFDRAEGLVVGQGGGPLAQVGPVIAIPVGGLVRERRDDGRPREEHGHGEHPLHLALS